MVREDRNHGRVYTFYEFGQRSSSNGHRSWQVIQSSRVKSLGIIVDNQENAKAISITNQYNQTATQ